VSAQLRAAGTGRLQPNQLAELSRRIVALGRLTAGVAHEVKNPLNAMTIHLELLQQKLNNPPAAQVHIDVIAQQIAQLDGVIQGFLKWVRPDEASFAPVEVAPLLTSVLDAVQPEADRAGVALQRGCGDQWLRVDGDAAMLRQAFLNLAQNAIQAMPKGGRLSISCAPVSEGRVAVRVADTGEGIPPENLAKIFDLYFTTKKGGSGIGLPVVYRTVSIHNGSIDVESTVGSGTTFVVNLPELQSK
jgi:signal transduction histidine kinase